MQKAATATCIAILLCMLGGGAVEARAPAAARHGPEIVTNDVDLFFQVFDAAKGHPTAAQVQTGYLDKGTEGLRTFARLRGTTAQRIVDAIEARPQLYAAARQCAAVLASAKPRLALTLAKLRTLYPAARLPPITIAIGRGKPVGIGSPVTGLQIGLEAMCGLNYMDADLEDRFVHVVAHEYVHVQQPRELVDDENPTALEGSLIEGAAEFVGELTSGGVSYAHQAAMVRGREVSIETAFVPDIDKHDLSAWLYNGTMEKPGDLGYWVGYRIVKSYYEHASDKRAAVRDIIEMRDPKAFLAKSGWRPGIGL